jgi:hypothetical protein
MSWFSKAKEEKEEEDNTSLPELPELPELPDIKEVYSPGDLPSKIDNNSYSTFDPQTNERSKLPPLPTMNKTNQSVIKSTINEDTKVFQKSRLVPQAKEDIIPSEPKVKEYTEVAPERLDTSNIEIKRVERQILTKEAEPVFIRLDKFKTTVQTFDDIKSKVEEIEVLLRKSKEIKLKEEQELDEWEREIQTIKLRLESIDKNIFNKLG